MEATSGLSCPEAVGEQVGTTQKQEGTLGTIGTQGTAEMGGLEGATEEDTDYHSATESRRDSTDSNSDSAQHLLLPPLAHTSSGHTGSTRVAGTFTGALSHREDSSDTEQVPFLFLTYLLADRFHTSAPFLRYLSLLHPSVEYEQKTRVSVCNNRGR